MDTWRNWATLSEGCYLLRTNIKDWSGQDLWQAYIQLTEVEAAFRIHKSDLKILTDQATQSAAAVSVSRRNIRQFCCNDLG